MSLESHCATPDGNTGVKPIELGLDWLAGTFPESAFEPVKALVEKTFTTQFSDEWRSLRWYEKAYHCPGGATLACSPRQGGVVPARAESYLCIPAALLNKIDAPGQQLFMLELREMSFSCSRLDNKLDDFSKTITPLLAYEAFSVGNITGFRVHKWITSGRAELPSSTLCLGSRGSKGSGKYLRIYDKWYESNGEIDSVRVELELSDHRAKQAFDMLCDSDIEIWPELIKSWIAGAVSFIDRTVDPEHSNQCPQLAWWAAIMADTYPMKLSKPKQIKTFQKAVNWIKRQVAPTFAMVLQVICSLQGSEKAEAFFWQLWLDGEKRYNENHLRIIAECIT